MSVVNSNDKVSPSEVIEEDKPDPFRFQCYREYLTQWIKYAKITQGEDLRAFAGRIGVSAEAMVRVLRNWKPMDVDVFDGILSKLDLSARERQFLLSLHAVSDAESPALRMIAFRKLYKFSEFREANPYEYEAWRYLSHWYYVAIREMAVHEDFDPRVDAIRARLVKKVPPAEIKKALDFLEQSGFLRVHKGGKVEPLDKEIQCSGGIYRIALGRFHRQMLDIASEAIDAVPSNERVLLGKTIKIPASRYEQVRRILEDALKQVSGICEVKEHGEVYHVEMFAVPLTRKTEKTNE